MNVRRTNNQKKTKKHAHTRTNSKSKSKSTFFILLLCIFHNIYIKMVSLYISLLSYSVYFSLFSCMYPSLFSLLAKMHRTTTTRKTNTGREVKKFVLCCGLDMCVTLAQAHSPQLFVVLREESTTNTTATTTIQDLCCCCGQYI